MTTATTQQEESHKCKVCKKALITDAGNICKVCWIAKEATTKISKQEKNNHPMIVQFFEELNKKYNTDLTPGSSPKTTACLYEELEARGIIEQDKQNEIMEAQSLEHDMKAEREAEDYLLGVRD